MASVNGGLIRFALSFMPAISRRNPALSAANGRRYDQVRRVHNLGDQLSCHSRRARSWGRCSEAELPEAIRAAGETVLATFHAERSGQSMRRRCDGQAHVGFPPADSDLVSRRQNGGPALRRRELATRRWRRCVGLMSRSKRMA
jgi:hypothetical protein